MSRGAVIPAPAGWGARALWWLRGRRAAPPKRLSSTYLLNLASGTFLVGFLIFNLVAARWGIGIVPVERICIPGEVFLLRHGSASDGLARGETVKFVARDLGPMIPDNTPLVKIVAGLPGDRVEVTADGVSINGKRWGPLVPDVMQKAKLSLEDVVRSYVIPEGKVLVLGTLAPSFDGRYFGAVDQNLITGHAWRLW